ncbi:MAG: hypothetical protein KDA87_21685, partial [Planctomycetales bacterium]|nr:hypothetical protein [Planctomycetales bacterium]
NPGGQRNNGGGGVRTGGLEEFAGGINDSPLTGGNFREWSDRLRDVEELIDDPELRAEAARIRDRARGIRAEFTRHSKEPQWPLVQELVANPLRELQRRVAEELIRKTGEKNATVPIDRDPVPERFSEQVKRYYEALGAGQ